LIDRNTREEKQLTGSEARKKRKKNKVDGRTGKKEKDRGVN
jgi:hypothetical protein